MSGVIRRKTDPAGASKPLSFDITSPPPWVSEIWRLAESCGTRDEIKHAVNPNGHGPALYGAAAGINQVIGWENEIGNQRAAELTLGYVSAGLGTARGGALYRDCKERWDAAAPGAFLAYEIARSLELPMPGAIFTSAALRSFRPLLTPWQLPRCIDEPIQFFHRPFGAGAYFLATAAVHVADKLVDAENWQETLDLVHPKVLDLLGVDDERMSAVRASFAERTQALASFRALLP